MQNREKLLRLDVYLNLNRNTISETYCFYFSLSQPATGNVHNVTSNHYCWRSRWLKIKFIGMKRGFGFFD